MAIVGKHNVLETVRIQKAPWWRLYENNNKRSSGNYIDTADFKDDQLSLDNSLEDLRRALDRLSTGTYVLVAFTSKDKTKGGIDTMIEIEGSRGVAGPAIGGFGTPGAIVVAGIGEVTSENFDQVLEAKFKKLQAEKDAENERKALKAENDSLKKQLAENDGSFNRGVMGFGAVIYDIVKSTPSGKEFIGMASKALLGAKQLSQADAPAARHLGAVDTAGENEEITGANEDRLTAALEKLSQGNPDFVNQLEKLARLKENDPGTFEVAVSALDNN